MSYLIIMQLQHNLASLDCRVEGTAFSYVVPEFVLN